MTDPAKAQARWEMDWRALAVSIGDGQPGSPDWEHGVAVLNARIGLHTAQAAEASVKLLNETMRLRRATWAMAWATIALVVATVLVVIIKSG